MDRQHILILQSIQQKHTRIIISLCNPRDHCTHSLLQDCCIVKLITSNRQTYLHRGTAPWRWTVLYALVRKTMHGVIVGKRVRTRRLSDRYCTRFWMSGMFWCDQQDYATVLERRVRTKSRDYTGWLFKSCKIALCRHCNTVRCHYNAVISFPILHNRHPIARPPVRGMGCLLWLLNLIHFLPLLSQCRM